MPGENVAVTLAGPAVTEYASTQAGASGAWSVSLAALPAGGPYTLTASGQNTVVLSDILMCDVWVCSGQSNMVLPLMGTCVGAVVLAAGGSSRLGRPKQLLPYRGRSLLRRTAEAAVASPCRPVLVVLGAGASRIERSFPGCRSVW